MIKKCLAISLALIVIAVLVVGCYSSPTEKQNQPEPTEIHVTTQEPESPPDKPPTEEPEPSEVTPPTPIQPQGKLKVHFIDVGQGDSILIDLNDIEVLIDGGERSPGVVDYLKDYVDGNLELMVATHPHADHIGGLIKVLTEFTRLTTIFE